MRNIGPDTFLHEACGWLHYHQLLLNPASEVEEKVKEACEVVGKEFGEFVNHSE